MRSLTLSCKLDWFPRSHLTSWTGIGQPLRKIHHPHNIVLIKVKLQLLEFTKRDSNVHLSRQRWVNMFAVQFG